MTWNIATADRFWMKVDKNGPNGCWLWTASCGEEGHGHFRLNGTTMIASRWAWEELRGPIPEGLHIDHLCREPRCVNPDHLEPVTPRVNTLRGNTPAARNAAKTHCLRGHPYDAANTYTKPDGKRRCRTCSREQDRVRKRLRRAA